MHAEAGTRTPPPAGWIGIDEAVRSSIRWECQNRRIIPLTFLVLPFGLAAFDAARKKETPAIVLSLRDEVIELLLFFDFDRCRWVPRVPSLSVVQRNSIALLAQIIAHRRFDAMQSGVGRIVFAG
jgi:hypothetical protein